MAAATSKRINSGTTLAEIFNVEPELLIEEFRLQPYHCYDPQEKDNLVFLSPTVCLEDLELREGGWKDRGAKEVLGLLAKDILKTKDASLFQVPEITLFHMGYGKRSQNKKNNMAISEIEAKAWLKMLDLASRKASKKLETVADGNDESVNQKEDKTTKTPMEVDFPTGTLPTMEDTHALEVKDSEDVIPEDVIDGADSGLKISVKSSYLLFFSILLIFYEKKLGKPSSIENNIGGNKISDFLLFWMLPYLLNYTEQQLNLVKEHHKTQSKKNETPEISIQVVQMSAKDIITKAFKSCNVPGPQQGKVLARLRNYYGPGQLERSYNLPKGKEPVILVPLRYQVTDMPVQMEDIGKRWREIGNVRLIDSFLMKLIESKKIQEDFFHDALKDLQEKEEFAGNYGILLPDEETFAELMVGTEDKKPDLFMKFGGKLIDKQGRDLATPRVALVRNDNRNVSVCFSYFQGNFYFK